MKPHPEQLITGKPADPYDTWAASPTPANMQKLLKHVAPTLNAAITTHAGGNVSPVVQGHAKLLAVRAIKSYDPTRNTALTSHLHENLRGLIRFNANATSPMQVSERRAKQVTELKTAENDFFEQYGHEATDEELADVLGLSVKRISKIREFGDPRFIRSTSGSATTNAPITNQHDPAEIWTDYVYHDLGAIDKQIMEHAVGYNGKAKLRKVELARRLNISPAAVSQRARKIQEKLLEGTWASI